ncbi:MAG: glycoside hydrolase family 127 protein [Phycisphaerae bacterium]|nr:glycoside hydrolase family 127 protein [Phycisphaerae bacterium]
MLTGCLENSATQKRNTEGQERVAAVERPDTTSKNAFYVSNREPLLATPFVKLPVGSILPKGWLLRQLQLQADGWHGHLTEISAFLKKERNAWLNPDGSGDHGWEEPPYWLKGFGNCAYVLQDQRMLEETKIWIEAALKSQKSDGWFGPDKGRTGAATNLQGREDLWPNMIMLFCLQDYYEYSGDERVIALMTNYMHYLSTVPEDQFIVGYWPKMRGADLLFSVYWLYNRTGDAFLLDLGHKVHRCTADWTRDIINWHNVNIGQAFGGPTTYYMQSKDPLHLEASDRNWRKIRDMYGQVPGGMFGSDENCRPGYVGPRQAVETCGMVEEMLSDETLLWITGNGVWADRCEDVAFNSFPASMTADLKALRYLTSPNMVLSDSKNKAPGLQNSGPMLHFNPHIHRCCQHNVGHGWPYYAQHLWLATPDNGLAAVLYSASEVRAKVGDGTEVKITENTQYPFEQELEFVVSTPRSVRFPLYLRIPGWCNRPFVLINGKAQGRKAPPLSYLVIDRQWSDGDTVKLMLPMDVSVRTWTQNKNSVSVDRGPLTYSLKIDERYVRHGGNDKWPAWEVYPDTPWNYGLVLNESDPAADFEVSRKPWPADDQPFEINAAPIALRAKAKKIPNWTVDHLGLVGEVQQSPVKSDEPTETVTLVPMGAARLRISAFPTIGAGPDAREWTEEQPPAAGMASHCWDSDTVGAVSDGLIPKNSSDDSIPRFTWWDHRGTKEWIQYDLKGRKKVSAAEVYWFDDTGVGQCRIPASWTLLYKDSDKWTPVTNPTAYGTEKDKFNKTTFDPVETTMLRIEAQLQPNVSAGILEWRVQTE